MTSYDDFSVRERQIWSPFQYAMRFTTAQAVERAIIFGLYSGAYKNGMNYLQTMEAFELAMILDEYNQKMAGLDAEEQNAILDIVTKRYIAQIEDLLEAEKRATKAEKIEAEDEAWDAKFEALEADRMALLTLEAQYEGRIREIEARIATLQAQILIEGADLQLVELDIAEKELAFARAENDLAGKDIDLALKDVELAERDIAIAQKDVEIAQKDIELEEQTNAERKLQLAKSQADLRSLEVGNDVLRIQLDTVNEALKYLEAQKSEAQMKIQTAGYDADIAKTTLIEVDLANASVEKTLADVDLAEQSIQKAGLVVDFAKIGMDKKKVDFEYLETDKEIANVAIDKHQTIAKSAELAMLAYDLEKAETDFAVDTANLSLYDAKIGIIDSQTASIAADAANEQAETGNITALHGAEMTIMGAEQAKALDSIANREEDISRNLLQNEQMEQLQVDLLNDQIPLDTQFTDLQITGIEEDTRLLDDRYDNEVAAYERVMEAELLTTLKHAIGKA